MASADAETEGQAAEKGRVYASTAWRALAKAGERLVGHAQRIMAGATEHLV